MEAFMSMVAAFLAVVGIWMGITTYLLCEYAKRLKATKAELKETQCYLDEAHELLEECEKKVSELYSMKGQLVEDKRFVIDTARATRNMLNRLAQKDTNMEADNGQKEAV